MSETMTITIVTLPCTQGRWEERDKKSLISLMCCPCADSRGGGGGASVRGTFPGDLLTVLWRRRRGWVSPTGRLRVTTHMHTRTYA
jgi:hypothetical protein